VSVNERLTVVREVTIAAPREQVFKYFIDPDKMIRWKGLRAELDPKTGGTYRVDMNGRDVIRGEYLEITPPSRVVFSFGWEGEGSPLPPGSSQVEIELIAEGAGTLVRLTHRNLPAEMAPRHAEGWEHLLERLVIAGAGGDPGPDPWAA
jgi:uncharacterized protein YndB with AHSA1/START domain